MGPERGKSQRRLLMALGLVSVVFAMEAAAGYWTGSLALLADAGHLLTDVGALALALVALWFARRPATMGKSYGYYRAEVFAALANGLTLWLAAGYVIYEAVGRLDAAPEVKSLPMVAAATLGLVGQSVAAWSMHRAASESLNARGAYVHLFTDAIQSVAVVGAGVVMLSTGWYLADPIVSIGISVFIFWSGARVAWASAHVLMEHSPTHVNAGALCSRLERVRGVTGVHDIHVWSITSGYEVLSAHVTTDCADVETRGRVLSEMQEIASKEFGIRHVTIQVEGASEANGCRQEAHHMEHRAQ